MKEQIFRLGKNSIIYGAGTMLNRFIGLLLLPVFTAYLTPTDYGMLSLLALLTLIAQPIFLLGQSVAMGILYFENNDTKCKSSTFWTVLLILLGSATILAAIGWLFSRELSMIVLRTPNHGDLVSLTLIGCAFSVISTPCWLRLQFEERAQAFVIITLFTSLLTLAISVAMVVYFGWGIDGMVISQVVGNITTFLLFFIVSSQQTKFSCSIPIAKEALRLGIPFVPSFAFLFLLMQSNRYILLYFEGMDQVGIYSLGFNFGAIMNMLVAAFSTAWYPFFMSYIDKLEDAKIIFGRILTYYVFGFGILTLVFFFAAKPVILIMTQKPFHEAYKVVGLCAMANYFTGISSLLLPGMYFLKEVKYHSALQGIASIISIPLNIMFVNFYGLLGAGIGIATGYLIMVILQIAWNIKQHKRYLEVNYETNRIIKFFVLLVAIVIIMMLNRTWSIGAELTLSLAMFTATIITTYYLASHSERDLFKSILSRFRASILLTN